ncbi:hypothetical protein RJ639_007959 [Escallonia herrerae]|uniref:Integrase catalytic domain-containing protein n=1 Tax=Escallonia herrerae TaxID=1293975 RepID=A0AA88VVI0_9ASTE|nr:hypothetical protein RJ639_007959 [Escallonia herrerae]
MKFPTEHGIGKVKGDQTTARQCYVTSCRSKNKEALIIEDLREDTKMQRGEPVEDLVSIEVYPGEENKTVRIGSNLKEDTKLELRSFEELKTHLSSPPLLSKPFPGEDLLIYLSVTEVAVSTVLIREEDGVQKPIYYVSKVLQDVETRYPKIDKIALALIISARRLRPYFQSHTIIVLTDQPLRKVLMSPEASGRLVNWSVELGEFDLQYKPRTAVKAQALADFIVECTLPEDPPQLVISEVTDPWNLYVDGSSAVGNSGAGIILISPEGILYKKSFSLPYLRCLRPSESLYALQEVHEGICGQHLGGRTLAQKILRQGYYWPTMQKDAIEFTRRCDQCQKFAPLSHTPVAPLTSIVSPIPFAVWGMDLLGPFPMASGQRRFVIVAIDYFTKWTEAESLATITSAKCEDFFWKNIICRFGVPRALVVDNGKQFDNSNFQTFCSNLSIDLRFTSVAHPQSNGQTENMNRGILQGLKKKLNEAKGAWVDELPKVLWAYRTTPHSVTGETPFSLCYGTEAMLPVEIGVPTIRALHFSELNNDVGLRANLDLVEEARTQAHINSKAQIQGLKSRARVHHQTDLLPEDEKLRHLPPLKAWQSLQMETPPQAERNPPKGCQENAQHLLGLCKAKIIDLKAIFGPLLQPFIPRISIQKSRMPWSRALLPSSVEPHLLPPASPSQSEKAFQTHWHTSAIKIGTISKMEFESKYKRKLEERISPYTQPEQRSMQRSREFGSEIFPCPGEELREQGVALKSDYLASQHHWNEGSIWDER